jgi:hypothetical protein
MEYLDQSTVANETENYYFEPLGESDYVLEAKIPFADIKYDEDAVFIPTEGMTIPFEVFATDADAPDGWAQGRVQLGNNPALNPWGEGPDVWTYAWIGMPTFTDLEQNEQIPLEYSLGNNYPNPFNPSTVINFSLKRSGVTKLSIYNIIGQEVKSLVDSELKAGNYEVTWNGRDDSSQPVASGVYFYRLQSGDFIKTCKMIMLK